MTMDQSEIRKRLSRFLDKEMSDREIRETEELIKNDPVWQEEYNRMLSLQHIADRLELEADDDIWEKSRDKILSKIEDEQRLETEITEIKKSYKRGTVYKLLAVAASIALIAFISLYQFDEISPNQKVLTTPQMKVNGRNIPVPEKISDEERRILESGKDHEQDETETAPNESTAGTSPEEATEGYKTESAKPVSKFSDKDAAIRKEEVKNRAMFDTYDKSPEQLLEAGDRLKEMPSKQLDEKQPGPAEAASKPEASIMAEPSFDKKKDELKIRGGRSGETTYRIDDVAQPKEKAGIETTGAAKVPISDSVSYVRAKVRADSLAPIYFDMVSEHYAEIAAKRRQDVSPKAERERAMKMATAFFEVGRLTGKAPERKAMIGRINELYEFVDSHEDSLALDKMVDSLRKIDE